MKNYLLIIFSLLFALSDAKIIKKNKTDIILNNMNIFKAKENENFFLQ